jgi:hypothetical protein
MTHRRRFLLLFLAAVAVGLAVAWLVVRLG